MERDVCVESFNYIEGTLQALKKREIRITR